MLVKGKNRSAWVILEERENRDLVVYMHNYIVAKLSSGLVIVKEEKGCYCYQCPEGSNFAK